MVVVLALSVDAAAQGWSLLYRVGWDIALNGWLTDGRSGPAIAVAVIGGVSVSLALGAMVHRYGLAPVSVVGMSMVAAMVVAYLAATWSAWDTPAEPCFAAGFGEVVGVLTALGFVPAVLATLCGVHGVYIVAKRSRW